MSDEPKRCKSCGEPIRVDGLCDYCVLDGIHLCCNCGEVMQPYTGYSNNVYNEYYCSMKCHTLQAQKRFRKEV